MSHVTDLFSHTGEPGQDANEAFDTQLDYRLAQERRAGGETAESPRGLIGSFALLVTNEEKAGQWQNKFDAWRERKRTERAERRQARAERRKAKNGSLADIGFDDAPAAAEPAKGTVYASAGEAAPEPRAIPVPNRPGVYHSNLSENQHPDDVPLSDAEYDEILAGAVSRARAALGEIPVAQMHQPETSAPDWAERDIDDAALMRRLENAYGQPAQEPDRSDHAGRHRAPDDELTSTHA